jgi:hypothetical protein
VLSQTLVAIFVKLRHLVHTKDVARLRVRERRCADLAIGKQLAIIIISNEATIMVDGATIGAAGNSAFISAGPCMSECEGVFADKGGV